MIGGKERMNAVFNESKKSLNWFSMSEALLMFQAARQISSLKDTDDTILIVLLNCDKKKICSG